MLSCDIHDYVEIAALYRLPVRLKMRNGNSVIGIAVDVFADDQKRECIMLETEDGPQSLVLDNCSGMEAMVKNRHFEHITFQK